MDYSRYTSRSISLFKWIIGFIQLTVIYSESYIGYFIIYNKVNLGHMFH